MDMTVEERRALRKGYDKAMDDIEHEMHFGKKGKSLPPIRTPSGCRFGADSGKSKLFEPWT